MKQTPNKFYSPKKPGPVEAKEDEWAKVDRLKRQKPRFKTEEQRVREMEDFEESYSSDFSLDSQTELPVERLNATPKSIKSNTELKTELPRPGRPGRTPGASLNKPGRGRTARSVRSQTPKVGMEPFNMREERDHHFIDSRGNFLYRNYKTHNDAWLLSLDEEVADPRILRDKQKTYQFALNQKISRARSEESSLLSGEDQMTPENFREQKIESLQTTLLGLLEPGESPNRAIKRFTSLLPGKKTFKPFKKNVRKNTLGGSPSLTPELPKPRLRQQSKSEKKKKLAPPKKPKPADESPVSVDPLLGKRGSFEGPAKVFSETSSVSSVTTPSLFDFEKKKLPKHLEKVGQSMMDSPSKSPFRLISREDAHQNRPNREDLQHPAELRRRRHLLHEARGHPEVHFRGKGSQGQGAPDALDRRLVQQAQAALIYIFGLF